jgi:type IV pilus assembly protein PilA
MNQSGWLSLLIILFPLYPILWLVFVFAPGTKGANRYGPQPIANSVGVIIGAVAMPLGSFTLIGILAAVALPAYHDYTTRARVSEALAVMEPVRKNVEAYFEEHQEFPDTSADIALSEASTSPVVESITVSDGGLITLTLRGNTTVDGKTIELVPEADDGNISWDCTGGTLELKHRPSGCRSY